MALTPSDINDIVAAHNKYRTAVGIVLLTWSDVLAAGAQSWADHLAAEHTFAHSGLPGENLAFFTTGFKTPAQLVDQWGAEEANFIPPCVFRALTTGDPCSTTGDWRNIGHYTQLVWSGTTEVGCGLAQDATTGNDILVARYAPPGNIFGQLVY